jgi:hypothetical protein
LEENLGGGYMTHLEIIAICKGYTNSSIAGAGAIKGAPCEVKSIEPIEGGNKVTFLWHLNDGSELTDSMNVMDGAKGDTGIGITRIHQSGNELYIYYSDGSVSDPIVVPTVKGDPGFSPEITVKESTSSRYVLHVKTEDDEYDTPNLRGGGAGIDMEVEDEVLIFTEE